MKNVAMLHPLLKPSRLVAQRAALLMGTTVLLGACSVLPDKPTRPAQFDLGMLPAPQMQQSQQSHSAAALSMPTVEARGALESGNAMLYRLAYADGQQLRPYAQSRWSMPAVQLLDQRLRSLLSRQRPVLTEAEGLAQLNNPPPLPRALRLQLIEFDHVFSSPSASAGVVQVQATLVQLSPDGERFVAQRQFDVRRDAPSHDAPGGVRALTAATDALAQELDQWMTSVP